MSSIINTVKKAYSLISEKYPLVYWNVDLHGVCFKSNYENSEYLWINDECIKCLQAITSNPINKLILWSSCHKDEQLKIIQFMKSYNINVDFFNENPLTSNTIYADFSQKYYFSILLDDKAGFEPYIDWEDILSFLVFNNYVDPKIFLHKDLQSNEKILSALSISNRFHKNQIRNVKKVPYILHPINVCNILYALVDDITVAMLCAALCHDLLEDTKCPPGLIKRVLGENVLLLVNMLTDVAVKSDGSRSVRIAINAKHTSTISNEAKTIKLADIIHNTFSIIAADNKFTKVYMAEKEMFLNVLQNVNTLLFTVLNDIIQCHNKNIPIESEYLSHIIKYLGD